jgi:hypothetical protein
MDAPEALHDEAADALGPFKSDACVGFAAEAG